MNESNDTRNAPDSRLVAVVVTHDRPAQLRETLDALLQSSARVLAAVVVVDNASGAETAGVLSKTDDPRLVVLRSERNLGGAGGFSRGIEHAMARLDPAWVVVMDDDARPEPGALEAFVACNPGQDTALAAAVRYPDGRVCEMNRPSVNPFWSPRVLLGSLVRALGGKLRDGYHVAPRHYQGATPLPVDLASFVGLFLPARVIRGTGLPDAGLFLYGDDVIYSLRLRRRGFTILFDPRVRFVHDCSTFRNDRRRVFDPVWKVYYTYRNGLIMYRAAAGWMFWGILPILVLKWLSAASRYGRRRAIYLALTRRALRDGLRQDVSLDHSTVLEMSGACQVSRISRWKRCSSMKPSPVSDSPTKKTKACDT